MADGDGGGRHDHRGAADGRSSDDATRRRQLPHNCGACASTRRPPTTPARLPQDALRHDFVRDLHERAGGEPQCGTRFDYAFERDYPDAMPMPLLQRLMFAEVVALRGSAFAAAGAAW